MKTPPLLFSAALCAVLLNVRSQAQTADWGTSYSLVGPLSYDSTGAVDNQVMFWTLGWFNDGYIPDATNFDTWAANYNIVDTNSHRNYPDPDPLDPIPNYWVTSGHKDDVGLAAGGKQMYTFVFNDLNLIGTEQGEVLMYRQDGLLFPTIPNQVTFDIANNPTDNGLAFNDDAFTVIWGQVDRSMFAVGGVLVGGGYISAPKPDTNEPEGFGTFEAQTATWTPIPEPSAAVLACLGSLVLLRRRRPSK